MMKERTCVYIGIFLILAIFCSFAMFYGVNGGPVSQGDAERSAISSPIALMLSADSAMQGSANGNTVMLISTHEVE